MNFAMPNLTSCTPRAWSWQRIAWIGSLFIALVAAMAAWDIARSYRTTVDETGRALDSQARVMAEQTARSLQTVGDVALGLINDQ